MIDKKLFINPPCEYRSAPFWSLNDKFIDSKLTSQINEMNEKGIGGFFMHPRGGMEDKYMGEDYMHGIEVCVKEAEKLGMKAWLYDEDRFPSGGAGGYVLEGNPEYAAKVLCIEIHKFENDIGMISLNDPHQIISCFVYNSAGGEYFPLPVKSSYEQDEIIDACSMKNGGVKNSGVLNILVFKVQDAPRQYMWNENSYTDLCNKEAVDKFIRVTHEAYKKKLSQYFGNTIPGIFTDEPSIFSGSEDACKLPWTLNFDRFFEQNKGYDLKIKLPELFFDIGSFTKTRFDYWEALAEKFVNSFTKNIYDWCEKNGLKFTGHFWEHSFPSPLQTAATMPNYEFMHYPGIDMLFNTIEQKDQVGNELIVKEVSSVANQLGKERVLSETYGASGWELTLEDQKRIADWQFSLGINLICQHLFHYSLKGERKRDFPLSFFAQPWWEDYRLLGDYLGRVSYLLSQGKYACDVAVIHSYCTSWSYYKPKSSNAEIQTYKETVQSICKGLMQNHIFYELADEHLMQKHSRVQKGKLDIGSSSYKVIVLPAATVIKKSTFDILKEFKAQGGAIICAGMVPSFVDGSYDENVSKFFMDNSILIKGISGEYNELYHTLKALNCEHIEIKDSEGQNAADVFCNRRVLDDKHVYFICNTSRFNDFANITIEFDSDISFFEEWDAVSGDIKILEPESCPGKQSFTFDMPVASSKIIVGYKKQNADYDVREDKVCGCRENTDCKEPGEIVKEFMAQDWEAIVKELNCKPLKLCRFCVNDGEWSEVMDVTGVDRRIEHEIGLGWRSIFSRQPWMYTGEVTQIRAKVKVEFEFDIANLPNKPVYAAIEYPDKFNVYINGLHCPSTSKYYKEESFVLHDISEGIKEGANIISLETDCYDYDTFVEAIYIVGDFKVEKTRTNMIINFNTQAIEAGDWTKQGYPYYSGHVQYRTCFELKQKKQGAKYVLQLDELFMVTAKVIVNGCVAKTLAWKPYEADITDFLKEGFNTIEIEVANSLQNMLGYHNNYETPGFCTPGSFGYGNGDVRFVESGFNGVGRLILL